MSDQERVDLIEYLEGGRQLLNTAADLYGRSLTPDEYWWLGVCLAASTLADLSGKPYAVNRLEQLVDRLAYKGVRGDWLQRFVEELAELDAEGLLWPVYQRSGQGPMEPTGLSVSARFDGEAAYFLTLAHLGVALAVHRDDGETVSRLASAIADMVERGSRPELESLILSGLRQEQR